MSEERPFPYRLYVAALLASVCVMPVNIGAGALLLIVLLVILIGSTL